MIATSALQSGSCAAGVDRRCFRPARPQHRQLQPRNRSQVQRVTAVSFPSFQGGRAAAAEDGAEQESSAPQNGFLQSIQKLFQPGKPKGNVAELRQALLDAIDEGGDVEATAEALAAAKPPRAAGSSELLKGRWSLLWSSPESDFARAKRRFGPIPTASVQLIGEAGGIEDDRAANLIQIAGGAVEVQLFSMARPDPANKNAISIGPPFTFKLKIGPLVIPLADNLEGDDANRVEQIYLEDSGETGDLRISRVGKYGEKKVEGSIFVHERVVAA